MMEGQRDTNVSMLNAMSGYWNSELAFRMDPERNDTSGIAEGTAIATIVEIILMSAILIAALIGNICLCWVVLSDEKLRSVPNKLVLNLAICGLFAVVANGPFILLTFVSGGNWIFGDVLCQVNGFTTSTYGLSSVLTLAVISVNRYQMIRRTTRRTYMWFTEIRIPFLLCGKHAQNKGMDVVSIFLFLFFFFFSFFFLDAFILD